jgi:NAD(P)-dependent dehydrogenase (short-subunit alcohol dehydrogenase family)
VTLATLKGRFQRPVYPGDRLSCETRQRDRVPPSIELQVRRGGALCTRIAFQLAEPGVATDAADGPDRRGADSRDIIDTGSLDVIDDRAALGTSGGLVAWQRDVLWWASRLIGTENPGRQALFSAFELAFADARPPADAHFHPSELTVQEDERFHLVTLGGRGPGVARFHLEAFRRPPPIELSIRDVEAAVGRSAHWAGKVALVAGAGRGFGRALSIALELQGATVAGASRRDVDLTSEDDCARLVDAHRSRHGGIDLLVLNASPPIEPLAFADQSAAWFDAFLTTSVRASAVVLRAALPLMPPGGQVLLISSSWVASPPAEFSHYIAAKAALEGLLLGVSVERADRTYVVARLPRMLTDQTNLVFDPAPPVSTPSVAARLLSALAAHDGRRYAVFDLT